MADVLAQGLQNLTLYPPGQKPVEGDGALHSVQPNEQQQQQQQEEGGVQGESASSHVAGAQEALQALRELIGWPSQYAREGAALGVQWPKGVLLHGPPGCGKTLLVRTVAEELGAALHIASAADVFGAYLGESEGRLRAVFEAAQRDADAGRTTVVFLDEVDALCPRRDGQRQHESRVVAQLLTLLDGAASGGSRGAASHSAGHVVVVAATNRPNALDPALRRPGRLDREVSVPVPNASERAAILGLHTQGLQLHPALDLRSIARSCHGYSGADLAAVAREAALHALSRAASSHLGSLMGGGLTSAAVVEQQQQQQQQEQDQSTRGSEHGGASSASAPHLGSEASGARLRYSVGAEDFDEAMRRVGPSIVRGMEVEVPHTSWDDIGGLPDVKRRLRQAVEWPLNHPDAFQRLGLSPPRGVLLYGPPGCSKTTLARAAASASKATLLPLSCAQVFSMFVGEGESLVRDVFRRARQASPAIVFLDEVDALAAKRAEGASAGGAGDASTRLLSTLLTEMDGMELATGVLVLGATNRPQAVDAALMRPGRFDALLYVPPPDEEGRMHVLRVHTKCMPLAADVDLAAIARDTANFTGAELANLCREAALAAVREDMEGACEVAARHFAEARSSVRAPALDDQLLEEFAAWGARTRVKAS